MEREVVVNAIQKIILDIKEKCIIKNTAIRDSIFAILENECTVIRIQVLDFISSQ